MATAVIEEEALIPSAADIVEDEDEDDERSRRLLERRRARLSERRASQFDEELEGSVGNILTRTRTQSVMSADANNIAEQVSAVAAAGGGDDEDEDEKEEYEDQPGCWGSFLCRPDSFTHRMIALALMSFLGFGSYFCFDNPGALQNEMREVMRINAFEFAKLYSWYSLPNIVLPVLGGYLIDGMLGMRLSTVLFAAIVCIGQVLFAAGAFFDMFILMENGRFVFGLGGESLAVAQNTYAVAWFKEKEINMVFGLQLAVARAGSSVNFWVVGPLFRQMQEYFDADTAALGMTLFICASTCVMSFFCSLALGWQDRRRERLCKNKKKQEGETGTVSLRGMLNLPSKFWLLSVVCMAYYSAVFTFISLGQVYLIKKYDLASGLANGIISSVYVASAPLSPLLGTMIDKFGMNVSFVFISIVLTLASHVLFAASFLDPWIPIAFLGVGYSLLASALWPIVALIVPESNLGTAYGLMQALQNGGMAAQTLIAGMIVDSRGYMWLEVFFILNLAVALVCTVFIWIIDSNEDGYLNMTAKERLALKRERKESARRERAALEEQAAIEERRKRRERGHRPRDSNEIRRRYLYRIGATAIPAHLSGGHPAINTNAIMSPASATPMAASVTGAALLEDGIVPGHSATVQVHRGADGGAIGRVPPSLPDLPEV